MEVYHLPNAFSPNGDGLNDFFDYYSLFITTEQHQGYNDYDIKINNRWGDQVFESNNMNLPWDGTYKNTPAPFGVYLYKIKFTDGTEKVSNISVLLHLLR